MALILEAKTAQTDIATIGNNYFEKVDGLWVQLSDLDKVKNNDIRKYNDSVSFEVMNRIKRKSNGGIRNENFESYLKTMMLYKKVKVYKCGTVTGFIGECESPIGELDRVSIIILEILLCYYSLGMCEVSVETYQFEYDKEKIKVNNITIGEDMFKVFNCNQIMDNIYVIDEDRELSDSNINNNEYINLDLSYFEYNKFIEDVESEIILRDEYQPIYNIMNPTDKDIERLSKELYKLFGDNIFYLENLRGLLINLRR